MIVALTELGIPLDDPRFVKDGHSLLDNLISYYEAGSGFRHTKTGSGNSLMATEQGFYALAAVQRARQGRNTLYRMEDAISIPDRTDIPPASFALPCAICLTFLFCRSF